MNYSLLSEVTNILYYKMKTVKWLAVYVITQKELPTGEVSSILYYTKLITHCKVKLAVYFITQNELPTVKWSYQYTLLHKMDYPLLSEVSSILYYTKLKC